MLLNKTDVQVTPPNIKEKWAVFFLTRGQSHYFHRPPGRLVHARAFCKKNNDRLIVISPGRGESSLKYAEVIEELSREQDIVVIDHRGQGLSGYALKNPSINYIDKFENYTGDFTHIVRHFQARKPYRASILLAHDMGTLIGLKAILKKNALFDGAVLVGPMLKLKWKKIPRSILLVILKTAIWLGLGKASLRSRHLSDGDCAFQDNRATSCRYRFETQRYLERLLLPNPVQTPCVKWLYEIVKNAHQVAQQARELRLPILLIQAGKEQFVCNKSQDRFAKIAQNIRVIRLKEGRHEILQEVDFIRTRALVQVRKFLREVQGARKPTAEA